MYATISPQRWKRAKNVFEYILFFDNVRKIENFKKIDNLRVIIKKIDDSLGQDLEIHMPEANQEKLYKEVNGDLIEKELFFEKFEKSKNILKCYSHWE